MTNGPRRGSPETLIATWRAAQTAGRVDCGLWAPLILLAVATVLAVLVLWRRRRRREKAPPSRPKEPSAL